MRDFYSFAVIPTVGLGRSSVAPTRKVTGSLWVCIEAGSNLLFALTIEDWSTEFCKTAVWIRGIGNDMPSRRRLVRELGQVSNRTSGGIR